MRRFHLKCANSKSKQGAYLICNVWYMDDWGSILSWAFYICPYSYAWSPPWLVERDHEYPMLENSFSPSPIYSRNNNPTTYQLFYKKLRNQTTCKKLPHSVQDHIFQVPNFKWKRFKSSSTEIRSSFCQTVLFVKV